ncbi:MAG: hypothetical protein ACPGU1_06685 [Myxococcota bacterium]
MSHGTRHSLPPFQAVTSQDGVLSVQWEPLASEERAAIVIALRAIGPELADDFWSGALDNDLIRQPVDATRTQATLYVPSGRPLLLTLIVRRSTDGPREGRPLHISQDSAPPATQTLESPVAHASEEGAHTPLIFAHHARPAGFDQLARQLAAQAGTPNSMVPRAEGPAGAFGARQRWTLTRLTWPEQGSAPLALVMRDTPIEAPTIASWASAPPNDASKLPRAADGLVDASCPLDDLRFYVLMRGPAPWAPVPLSPVPPPFDAAQRPHILGDLGARLTEGVEGIAHRLEHEELALSDVAPLLTLLRGAVALLSSDHPLQRRVEQIATRWKAGRRL